MDPARDLCLAESLTTRLCHDMAGLVATLSGTLEMVLEDQGEESEAATLAAEAARAMAVRLRLYRAAWGGGDMEQAPLSGLAEGLPNRARLTLDLAPLDEARRAGALDEGACRLVLCLLLAATAGMPAGGIVRARLAPPGMTIDIAGRNAAWPAALGDSAILPPSPQARQAAALAAPMARMLAASMGWRLQVAGEALTARPG